MVGRPCLLEPPVQLEEGGAEGVHPGERHRPSHDGEVIGGQLRGPGEVSFGGVIQPAPPGMGGQSEVEVGGDLVGIQRLHLVVGVIGQNPAPDPGPDLLHVPFAPDPGELGEHVATGLHGVRPDDPVVLVDPDHGGNVGDGVELAHLVFRVDEDWVSDVLGEGIHGCEVLVQRHGDDGEVLVRQGALTAAQLSEALKDQKRRKALLGRLLLQTGHVTEKNLHDALRTKIQEEIYDLFLWTEGVFEFHMGSCPEDLFDELQKSVSVSINTNGVIMEGLRRIPGISCPEPEGAFYAFPSIRGTGMSSQEFQDRALHEAGVALLSGTSFGRFGEGYVRLSYANSQENIGNAMDRLESFVSGAGRKRR